MSTPELQQGILPCVAASPFLPSSTGSNRPIPSLGHDNLCQHFRIHRQNPADQAAMEGLDMSRLGVGSASDSNHSGSRRSSGVSATSNTSKGSNEGYDDDEDDDQEGEDADEGFLSE